MMNSSSVTPARALACLAILLAGCSSSAVVPPTSTATLPPPSATPSQTQTPTETPTYTPSATPLPLEVRFAVIGDYGWGGIAEAEVAALVHSWEPDLIITVGDNNYPVGAAEVIDEHIGQFYQDYIFPYAGAYGPGATENRFFPTLGNHDWYTSGAQPYFDYFTLPGNERYYDFTWGPVDFFAIDSDENEPDGVNAGSIQAAWLQERMAAATSPWQVVYFHYAPYSSAAHGSIDWMRWPFAAWGAEAVLSGHDHAYERLLVDGIPYFVNGTGGAGIYNFNDPLPETQFRYNADNGAMLVTASETEILFEFYSRAGNLIDSCRVVKP
jgi:tartrate-resistant acid phosphatase type 5